MAGYFDYTMSKRFGAPEDSYLYSDSASMSPKNNYLGGDDMSSSMASGGGDGGSSAASMGAAGASGAAMGGPVGAGIAVGGQFLTNYLAQKAADERARRERESRNIQQYAQNQNQGLDTMMSAFRGALR